MASHSDKNLDRDASDQQPGQLLLTETASEDNIPQLQPGGPPVKLDDLGPMVVNSDGTLSRISNWSSLTAPEKERTLRVLTARNKIRLANEEQKLKDAGESAPS